MSVLQLITITMTRTYKMWLVHVDRYQAYNNRGIQWRDWAYIRAWSH